jgi:hypothetical protein
MLPEIPVESFVSTLETLVADQLDLADIVAPPVDAFLLADALGLVVARDDQLENRARLVRLNYAPGHSTTSILLAPEPREERRHWSVAHEIGEYLAERVCRRLGIRAAELPVAGREQLANQLANRILLPGEWFFEDARRLRWDLLALKQRYGTASHELIARRMLDGRPPIIISVFDHDRLTWRRSNLPGRAPPLSAIEHSCRAEAHETGETSCCEPTCAWAVHEPDWKREILRTEINAFGAEWE